MVSTRRKPASKSTAVVNETTENEATGNHNAIAMTNQLEVTTTESGVDLSTSSLLNSIVASDGIHQVSCNSSSSSGSNSDNSTVETTTVTTTKSLPPSPPLAVALTTSKANDSTITSSSLSLSNTTVMHPTTSKSVPKKKPSKPLKPSLKHTSAFTTSSRRNTPSPGSLFTSSSLSPTKRSAFGITSSAHTRSNAGTAELLKGVEAHIVGKATVGGVTTKHQQSSKGFTGNVMIGKNATKQAQKDNKDGILTIRNGVSVRKIIMNTGTLYIDLSTHRAEFVRTK